VAQVVLGSYMVRYPLGGMISWVLQYLTGFDRLGHDVYFVEKADYPDACYDPSREVVGDDCTYGVEVLQAQLDRLGLGDRWCFVDVHGKYHGLSREHVEGVFRSADVFVDMGTHGSWLDEAAPCGLRVLIDGEPGFTQIKMANRQAHGEPLPEYDAYYTTGRNVGTTASHAPTAGRTWRPIFHPVDTRLVTRAPEPPRRAPFTTVMNWRSHAPIQFRGTVYGQKDREFAKFIGVPRATEAPLELAVSGHDVPHDRLAAAGWSLRNGPRATRSVAAFYDYLRASRGELGVCKEVFVSLRTGWFSDRSAAYLACGRPVLLQETGYSDHLPTGEGLFAVETADDAAGAIEEINRDYARHARRAREIATEFLDASKVLTELLRDLGIRRG
jgi:hypothetical protein